jgi:hypothetical protein
MSVQESIYVKHRQEEWSKIKKARLKAAGWIGGGLSVVSYGVGVVGLFKDGTTASDAGPFAFSLVSNVLWTWYGIEISDVPTIITSASIMILSAIALVYIKIVTSRKKKSTSK